MTDRIDAVITWVDGDDPRHKAKRQAFTSPEMVAEEHVAGATRFSSLGEIFYCVASINRFAPWINKIYIVTDEQNPQLEPFLEQHFPQGYIPIEIIDHKTIFRGYEEYLPTFNSISIESMTWRIPGLSDKFIEFNDDLILAAPVTPEDFFGNEGVVCYAEKKSYILTALTRLFKRSKSGSRAVSYKGTMLNAAALVGNHRYFLKMDHTPKGLLRTLYEEYFTSNREALLRNISHRFRHASQYNPQQLQYLLLHKQGLCNLRPVKGNLLYLKPKKGLEYIEKKLAKFSQNSSARFGCFNSLDMACEEGRNKIVAWIKERIGLED
jgi:hypothetical protein